MVQPNGLFRFGVLERVITLVISITGAAAIDDDDDVMAAGPFATGEHTQCPGLKKKSGKRKTKSTEKKERTKKRIHTLERHRQETRTQWSRS